MEELRLRLAALDDVAAIAALIDRSVRTLQVQDYSPGQIEGALGTVFGVDRQLILDQSYYVIEAADGLAACGGWSRRRTLFGADGADDRDDQELTPGSEPAKIRAFFVDPRYARRGLASRLLQVCEAAAQAFGFTEAELGATLTGEPLYARHGYAPLERYAAPLRNGLVLPLVRMARPLGPAALP